MKLSKSWCIMQMNLSHITIIFSPEKLIAKITDKDFGDENVLTLQNFFLVRNWGPLHRLRVTYPNLMTETRDALLISRLSARDSISRMYELRSIFLHWKPEWERITPKKKIYFSRSLLWSRYDMIPRRTYALGKRLRLWYMSIIFNSLSPDRFAFITTNLPALTNFNLTANYQFA